MVTRAPWTAGLLVAQFSRLLQPARALVGSVELRAVFDSLDDDKSGLLEYKELAEMLRKGAGADAVERNLKRMKGKQRDDSRGAKLTAKNINKIGR